MVQQVTAQRLPAAPPAVPRGRGRERACGGCWSVRLRRWPGLCAVFRGGAAAAASAAIAAAVPPRSGKGGAKDHGRKMAPEFGLTRIPTGGGSCPRAAQSIRKVGRRGDGLGTMGRREDGTGRSGDGLSYPGLIPHIWKERRRTWIDMSERRIESHTGLDIKLLASFPPFP
jgi:hypothetical protein